MEPGATTSKLSPVLTTVIAVIVVLLIVGAIAFARKDDSTVTEATATPMAVESPASESMTSTEPAATSYVDGTYSASGSYSSPGGAETVSVSMVVANDVVTDVTVTPNAANPTSKQFQTSFADGIDAVVVGKKIDTLSVSKISGSSLTSKGFNDALAKIKAEAKS